MDSVSLQLAFSRLGVEIAGKRRPLCATATDGSLVMVCQSSGFSRPGVGVLRYSARLSMTVAAGINIEALRQGLNQALSGRTPIRLIIQTPGPERSGSKVHMRADLVGSVAAFDGDAYSVDFVPIAAKEPALPPPRKTRKR